MTTEQRDNNEGVYLDSTNIGAEKVMNDRKFGNIDGNALKEKEKRIWSWGV